MAQFFLSLFLLDMDEIMSRWTMKDKLILLAEDDQDDRVIFYEAFEELNINNVRLETVEDGIDVINRLKDIVNVEDLPSLFILDQNMPKMTGKATLAYLKANDRYKKIPVIIYSTYPDSSLVNEFVNLGAEHVIAKPDSYNGFKEMVHTFIRDYMNEQPLLQDEQSDSHVI
jgi:CheY-like chemotaxis protein